MSKATISDLVERMDFISSRMLEQLKLGYSIEDIKKHQELQKEIDDYIALYRLEDEINERNLL